MVALAKHWLKHFNLRDCGIVWPKACPYSSLRGFYFPYSRGQLHCRWVVNGHGGRMGSRRPCKSWCTSESDPRSYEVTFKQLQIKTRKKLWDSDGKNIFWALFVTALLHNCEDHSHLYFLSAVHSYDFLLYHIHIKFWCVVTMAADGLGQSLRTLMVILCKYWG